MKTAKLANSYRVNDGKHFRLKDFDPLDTWALASVEEAKEQVQKTSNAWRSCKPCFMPRIDGRCC